MQKRRLELNPHHQQKNKTLSQIIFNKALKMTLVLSTVILLFILYQNNEYQARITYPTGYFIKINTNELTLIPMGSKGISLPSKTDDKSNFSVVKSISFIIKLIQRIGTKANTGDFKKKKFDGGTRLYKNEF
jgi:hypothetical protein